MDELFITDAGQPQTGKLESSSVQALQDVHFLGRPLLNYEVPNFELSVATTEKTTRVTPYSPTQKRDSHLLPVPIPIKVYNKPTSPIGKTPAITYSRTLYRKSDYSAYKQLPQMPDFNTDKVPSKSGLFLTPPGSPSDTESLSRNFSRKMIRKEIRRCHSHVPTVERADTFQSESVEIQSTLGSPVSAMSEHASFVSLADSLRRSLSPPSPSRNEECAAHK